MVNEDDARAASAAARALSKKGASKGGRARASVLTPEERSRIAQEASRARWAKEGKAASVSAPAPPMPPESKATATGDDGDIPYSAFPGTVQMGDVALECHVLNDGRRVLTAREVVRALRGTTSSPTTIQRYLGRLPGYVPGMFDSRLIDFRIPGLPSSAIGFEATVLIEICDMYIAADEAGKLKSNQKNLARMAGVIMRSCAKTGIVALIDEATGYQKVRERRALQVKLQAFIAEEMQEWVTTFPEEFWQELARLEGIRYQARHRPLRWGQYVMRFVNDSIDPALGRKLREINPNPHFRQNHHQWLREFGRDKLHRQLGGVIAIMRDCKDMAEFKSRFERVFEKKNQLAFDLDWADVA